MTYSIVSATTANLTLTVTVNYIFSDNSSQIIDVPIFSPRDTGEVILGITNVGNIIETNINNLNIINNLLNGE